MHRAETRIIEFVLSLSTEELSRTWFHKTFGEITVEGSTEIMVLHAKEHLRDLRAIIAE